MHLKTVMAATSYSTSVWKSKVYQPVLHVFLRHLWALSPVFIIIQFKSPDLPPTVEICSRHHQNHGGFILYHLRTSNKEKRM